jgi:hypothetical protein
LSNRSKLTDSLALTLVADFFDLPRGERESLMRKAVSVAACDEEKYNAILLGTRWVS